MEDIVFENITFSYPETERPVFGNFSHAFPRGVISLVGQNGTGKSTLLLLAGAVLLPQQGRVMVCGRDSRTLKEERERHRYVSFIYQNMEFETEEVIGDLFSFVFHNGFIEGKDETIIKSLVDVFELEHVLNKKTQEVSKGELQRTILAFSLLYGSRIIMMDEPIFAMENYQKVRTMDFITSYAKKEGISVYYSVHELDITEKYSDYMLLFFKSGIMKFGPTKEVFSIKNLEEAYEAPYVMLKKKEAFFRSYLMSKKTGN
ncbi:MAG: ABC transporter ATP-binding protein [Spirochaetales bacterium]|nr:ABC transporter ATP-binding protein [Spirochaetales bacterium]